MTYMKEIFIIYAIGKFQALCRRIEGEGRMYFHIQLVCKLYANIRYMLVVLNSF